MRSFLPFCSLPLLPLSRMGLSSPLPLLCLFAPSLLSLFRELREDLCRAPVESLSASPSTVPNDADRIDMLDYRPLLPRCSLRVISRFLRDSRKYSVLRDTVREGDDVEAAA